MFYFTYDRYLTVNICMLMQVLELMATSGDIREVEMIDVSQESAGDRALSVQGGPTAQSQMVSIKLDKLPLLKSLQQKVERNYFVEIREEICCTNDEKSAPDMQWISISGSKGDCKDAGVRIYNILYSAVRIFKISNRIE